MTTATNPGLQAYIKAYNILKTICEQAEKALDYEGVMLPCNVHLQLRTLREHLRREMDSAEKLLDEYVDEVLDGDTLEKILDQLGPGDIDQDVHAADHMEQEKGVVR